MKQEAERERERGSRHASISQQGQAQVPGLGTVNEMKTGPSLAQQSSPPSTREGEQYLGGNVSGITMGMRGVSLEHGGNGSANVNANGNGHGAAMSGGQRRLVSPELSRA